jgi:opacity protein-like surface antigen
MFSVKYLVGAAAAALLSSTAFAADMAMPPQPVYQPVVMDQGGWYLRGNVGIGLISEADIDYEQNPLNHSNFQIQHSSIGDTPFFMVGAGYELNNWLRFDVTAEYRSKADVDFFGVYNNAGTFGDQYHGYLQSAVFLANAYVDLGTWDCLTPFVGVGVGGAWNKFAELTDIGIGTSGFGIGRNSSDFNFAWALHAGLSYAVTRNFSVELAYRYLNYGSVTDTIDCAGGCNPDSYKLHNLSSNDLMLGMRWRFPVDSGFVVSTPVMMQPAPAPMAPPPPQYPLSTRG